MKEKIKYAFLSPWIGFLSIFGIVFFAHMIMKTHNMYFEIPLFLSGFCLAMWLQGHMYNHYD